MHSFEKWWYGTIRAARFRVMVSRQTLRTESFSERKGCLPARNIQLALPFKCCCFTQHLRVLRHNIDYRIDQFLSPCNVFVCSTKLGGSSVVEAGEVGAPPHGDLAVVASSRRRCGEALFPASGILDCAPVAFDHVVNCFLPSRRTLKEENGLPGVLDCNHPDLIVASDRCSKADARWCLLAV